MNNKIEDYFYWTRRERNGVLLLIAIIIITWASSHIYEFFYQPPATDFTDFFDIIKRDSIAKANESATSSTQLLLFTFNPNTAIESEFLQLGLPKKVVKTILNYRNKGGRFYKKEDFKRIYGLTTSDYNRLESFIEISPTKKVITVNKKKNLLFHFDPNIATAKDFIHLGLNTKIANNIIKYRNKGGHFNKKEDFKKIYGVNLDIYQRLEPYIDIPVSSKRKEEITTTKFKKKTQKNNPVFVDINKSTASDWQQLKGIGEKRAERIIKYREKLGGFGTVYQVAETWGLPDSTFQAIKPFLQESPILQKIKINTISFKELLKHPLFNYNKTQIIINYRYQHGDYHSMKDIKKVGGSFTDADFDKIAPYLSFQSLQDSL